MLDSELFDPNEVVRASTHITDDIQRTTAAEGELGAEEGRITPPQQKEPKMTDFKPYMGRKRKPGGCISQISEYCWEGRYSPKWPDGKKHSRNVYAHTREECEEKLKVLIVEMKAEIAESKRLKELGEGDSSPPEEKTGKRGKQRK